MRRTGAPLEPSTAPGCPESTLRSQTPASIWTIGRDNAVIPRVTLIRCSRAFPLKTRGSL